MDEEKKALLVKKCAYSVSVQLHDAGYRLRHDIEFAAANQKLSAALAEFIDSFIEVEDVGARHAN
jgi:hypothetical protein